MSMKSDRFVFTCSQIKFKYPQQRNYLLKGIDFEAKSNNAYKFIGINGSGKSTLFLILSNLLSPSSGNIYFNEKSILDFNFRSLSEIIGLVFQNPSHQIFGLKVNEEIEFGLKNQGVDSAEIEKRRNFILNFFGFNDMQKKSLELSFGWKKILALSSIYVLKPKILILDEPDIGLDPYMISKVELLLHEYIKKGNTVIFSSHNQNFFNSENVSIYEIDQGLLNHVE